MYVDPSVRRALLPIKEKIKTLFDDTNWIELATLTDSYELVTNHPRLLRSLSFGDPDYEGNVLSVLNAIVGNDPANFQIISDYVDELQGGGVSLSGNAVEGPRYYIQPNVFKLQNVTLEADLVSVMMPFSSQFTPVYEAIKRAAASVFLRCTRADDIWENSVLIQDIFDLILRSNIVVCDFSGKNPNVFYEAGIAHTLGKHVVPLTQNDGDVPADLRHHRYLGYLNNGEGLARLETRLASRFRSIASTGA
ncbi:hypothetical protein AB9E06_05905 [Rhizobium leguminosarum]|uniref:hypothetical protein n=1 Tax=Rhizobium TaxID=379 RepID=UPI001C82CB68|nr:hypothetical protein [Rhizobium sp. NZLR1b]MBX5168777.1 hypothetical protein [Rhizobium sp. NZLR1b]